MSRRASGVKMVGMAEMAGPLVPEGTLGIPPISLDWVAVHPDCWCVCLCYLHFAPDNPEDGEVYLLVPADLGCPGQSPQSCKMVVSVRYFVYIMFFAFVVFCVFNTSQEIGWKKVFEMIYFRSSGHKIFT